MDEDIMMNDIGVEDAPDSSDVDVLLGMTDTTQGSSSGNLYDDNDDIEVSELHWKIPVKFVNEALRVSSLVSASGENNFDSKILTISHNNGDSFVSFLITDNKRDIKINTELLNTENVFDGTVSFSASNLAKIVKMCSSIFILVKRIVDDKDKYILKVLGGEIVVDNYKMDKDKYSRDYSNIKTNDFKKNEVMDVIKKLYTFASSSMKSGKNLDFDRKVVQAMPINSIAKVTMSEEYPAFKLPLTDSRILFNLCGFDSSESLGISKDGKVFRGNSFEYKTETFPVSKCVFDSVAERMFTGNGVTVNYRHFVKVIDLACSLDSMTGSVKFNYKDGLVLCELESKRDNSSIYIDGDRNESINSLDSSIEVLSGNIKSALSVFLGNTFIVVRLSPDGIAFESGNTRVSVLSKNAGK